MNEKPRTWENDMSDAFDHRVRDLHEAPVSFEQVTTRARRIKRHRQAAVAGGILAVAAVIAPIAVVVGGNGGDDDIPAATDTPSPTASDSSPALPDNGPTPTIGSLQDGDFVRGDGVVFDLPGTGYTRVDQIGGNEIVAYRYDETTTGGGGVIDVMTAPAEGGTSELVESIPVADSYVASSQGFTIAYRTREGEIVTRWDGGEQSFGSDYPEDAFPVAVTGGPECRQGDSCLVYLNDGSGQQPPIALSSDGTVTTPVPDAQVLRDADASGLLSVQTSFSDNGSCGGLYDTTAGSYLFETCDYTIGRISPSGEQVLAGPAYLDGLGDSFIAILDREGTEVARWEQGGTVVSRAWETPGDVVFTVYDEGSWSVWRLSIDGKSRQLTEPVAGSDLDAPVQFFG